MVSKEKDVELCCRNECGKSVSLFCLAEEEKTFIFSSLSSSSIFKVTVMRCGDEQLTCVSNFPYSDNIRT